MKIAYFCEPQYGGTYSFFSRIRPRLASRGVELRCIPPVSGEQFAHTPFEAEEFVDYVAFPAGDDPAASRVLIEHLEKEGYDAVIVLPGSDTLCVNLVRYLPRRIRSAARVPMITRGAYAPTRAIEPHLDLVFAVSHRVRDDLVGRYHVPEEKVRVVYNGADVSSAVDARTYGQNGEPFRLMYSGRLWDLDKGVLLLPEILERACRMGVNAQLTVVGSGPDEERLRDAFTKRGVMKRVQMTGNVPLDRVEDLLGRADCFVLPSRFEGCPNALLEAMASGCPSVAARIRGSVSRIIEDGISGLLAEVAEPVSFARAIAALAAEPKRCELMSQAASARISAHFSIEHTAEGYAHALATLADMPDRRERPRSLDHYDVPSAMQPTWRTHIPDPVKNMARKWLERFGISS